MTASVRAPRAIGFTALDLLVAVHETVKNHLRRADTREHLGPTICLDRLELDGALPTTRGEVPRYRLVVR